MMQYLVKLIPNFFTHKDFLPKADKLAGTLFTPLHFAFSAVFLLLVILLALRVSHMKEKSIRICFGVLWVLLILFEAAKIIWETYAGVTVDFEAGGVLPLYPCSIFMYAMPLAIWGNQKLRYIGCGYVCTLGLLGGLINFVLAKYFIERVRNNSFPAKFPAINWDIKFTILDNVILGVIQSLLIALGIVLFIVPGIILACSYSMVYFIKCDNPEISAFDALSLSKRMMDGHKMEYFRLQLSFIGWYILGFLCFGIGAFWASAYNQAANAAFYEEIREVKY